MGFVLDHRCNAYCRDGEHATVVFSRTAEPETFGRWLAALVNDRDEALVVTGYAPAPEARQPDFYRRGLGIGHGPGGYRRLTDAEAATLRFPFLVRFRYREEGA